MGVLLTTGADLRQMAGKIWVCGYGLVSAVDVVVQRVFGTEYNALNGSCDVCKSKTTKWENALTQTMTGVFTMIAAGTKTAARRRSMH